MAMKVEVQDDDGEIMPVHLAFSEEGIEDVDALFEARWRARRGDLDEALINLVRAIPDLHNLLKLSKAER